MGLAQRPSPLRLHLVARAGGHMGLASAIDLVEQVQVALLRRLRHCLGHRQPQQWPVSDQALIRRVDEFEHMVRAAQHGHEAGRLRKHLRQTLALLVDAARGQHLLRGFGADDEHAAHAAGCTVVVDRAIAVGPVDLLQLAVAKNRQQLVLMPSGAIAAQHQLDLGLDRLPDFRPGLLARHAQDAGMFFRAQRRAVGVVVQADVLLTPEDEDRMQGRQSQAHHGFETGPPAIRRAQDRGLPVVGTDAPRHLTAALQKVDFHGHEYRSADSRDRTISGEYSHHRRPTP